MRTPPNFQITSPSNGQVLSYNGTAWVNSAGGGGPVTKRVASNLSYAASTTISDFTFAAAANTTYLVHGLLVITHSNEASPVFDVDGPSGFSANGFATSPNSTGAAHSCTFDESGALLTMTVPPDVATETPTSFYCIVRTSSTAGDVSFDIGTEGGGGTNSLLAGSSITITEIA